MRCTPSATSPQNTSRRPSRRMNPNPACGVVSRIRGPTVSTCRCPNPRRHHRRGHGHRRGPSRTCRTYGPSTTGRGGCTAPKTTWTPPSPGWSPSPTTITNPTAPPPRKHKRLAEKVRRWLDALASLDAEGDLDRPGDLDVQTHDHDHDHDRQLTGEKLCRKLLRCHRIGIYTQR
jgi:hypothetical protein